ncbi:hypothetical protein [Amycolatopsis aidingensis]|uniref:hypothetical protein n=1 Tax=Amycolatopsis aidingensis TaxID=2842453 RepID=UPI001E61AD98|nr:hypothetical protein [Amycolatopsis aidingensis]
MGTEPGRGIQRERTHHHGPDTLHVRRIREPHSVAGSSAVTERLTTSHGWTALADLPVQDGYDATSACALTTTARVAGTVPGTALALREHPSGIVVGERYKRHRLARATAAHGLVTDHSARRCSPGANVRARSPPSPETLGRDLRGPAARRNVLTMPTAGSPSHSAAHSLFDVAARSLTHADVFALSEDQQAALGHARQLLAAEAGGHAALVVTGGAGSGKSALALTLLGDALRAAHPAIAPKPRSCSTPPASWCSCSTRTRRSAPGKSEPATTSRRPRTRAVPQCGPCS